MVRFDTIMKKMEYNIMQRSVESKQAERKLITGYVFTKEVDGVLFSFGVDHRYEHTWIVTELSSGTWISDGSTRKYALENFESRMSQLSEGAFTRARDCQIKQSGYANEFIGAYSDGPSPVSKLRLF